MAKKSPVLSALCAFLSAISILVILYAYIPFSIKFLVDVIAKDMPFWSTFFHTLIMIIMTEVIAFICLCLFGGALGYKALRKN